MAYTISKFQEREWSEWSVCSKKCGGGERTRTMKRSTQFSSSLTAIQDSGILKETCNTQACEGILTFKQVNIYAHFSI